MTPEEAIPAGYGLRSAYWAPHLAIPDTELARRWLRGRIAVSRHGRVSVNARGELWVDGAFCGYWVDRVARCGSHLMG